MENVEHLGQYVYEMTNAKVQQLRAERGLAGAPLVEKAFEGVVEEGLLEEMVLEVDDGEEEEEEGSVDEYGYGPRK